MLAVLAVCLPAGGCGGIKSPDLFIVYRSGSSSHAKLTLLVTEEGIATCNGGKPHRLEDPEIIKARDIQEDLHDPAVSHLSLAPRPGSVLRYFVRDVDGSVHFADNSLHQPAVLHQLALFVLQTAQHACGLSE